jgi:hypothetical protein
MAVKQETILAVLDLHRKGLVRNRIATFLGVGKNVVARILKERDLTPNATIGNAKGPEIMRLHAMGVPAVHIAEQTGENYKAVYDYIRNRGHRPIPAEFPLPRVAKSKQPKVQDNAPPQQVSAMIRTGGRYSEIMAIASARGWSSAKAMQEFHKARAVM